MILTGEVANLPIVRPERDEELRLEAASRAAGGPFGYRGTRQCPACELAAIPQHPGDDDHQVCGNCGADLPKPPVTWMIRDADGGRHLFILRQGDRCISGGGPVHTSDDEINQALAGNIWLNLEYRLGLVTLHPTGL